MTRNTERARSAAIDKDIAARLERKPAVSIPMLYIRHGDTVFGAGGCDVHVGTMDKLPAIAVSCARPGSMNPTPERRITDQKGAQSWLHERGLPLMVAWGLVNEVQNGVGADVHGAPAVELEGKKLWNKLNALSHRFAYDGPEARALTEAAQHLKERDL